MRFFVGVELVKIPRVVVGVAGPQPAPGIAGLRVLDLDDLGAEPSQRLGAGRTRLELGEVHDPHACETIEFHAVYCCHRSPLLPEKLLPSL